MAKQRGARKTGRGPQLLDGATRARVLAGKALDQIEHRAIHGPEPLNGLAVERATVNVLDAQHTHYGSPRRTRDTLTELLQRGEIGVAEESAGRKFQDDFQTGGLHGLKAAALLRLAAGPDEITDRALDARHRIRRAVAALGGFEAPATSIAWAVLGEGKTISDCAACIQFHGGRSIRHEVAKGLLIACLGSLSALYNPAGRRKKRGRRAKGS